jgi:hypothetical protein
MPIEPEIRKLAEGLLARHGADARHLAAQARLRARQGGDVATERAWSLVLKAIAEMKEPARDEIGSIEDVRAILRRLEGVAVPPRRRFGIV